MSNDLTETQIQLEEILHRAFIEPDTKVDWVLKTDDGILIVEVSK